MRLRREIFIITLLGVSLTLGLWLCPNAAQTIPCEELNNLSLQSDVPDDKYPKDTCKFDVPRAVRISSATVSAATSTLPERCVVIGTIIDNNNEYDKNIFEVMLPSETVWNNNFFMVGSFGGATKIPENDMLLGVSMGYAAAGFYPNDPCRLVHQTAVIAKQIIEKYYEPEKKFSGFSYFVGCSAGGRQGLMEAQAYPYDFNGILSGSAVNKQTTVWMETPAYLQPQSQLPGGSQELLNKLQTLGRAVYEKCDGIDGLVDGIIDDPRNCTFDPEKDLPRCPEGVDNETCFTNIERAVIKEIYEDDYGVYTILKDDVDTNVTVTVPGMLKGAELFKGGWDAWIVAESIEKTTLFTLHNDQFEKMMTQPGQPLYNFLTDWQFSDTNDIETLEKNGLNIDAVNPNLNPFKNKEKGGKIIMYHGWEDITPATATVIDYYESVKNYSPDVLPVQDVLSLYMVPGMGHCGGRSPFIQNWNEFRLMFFDTLVDWVERADAPESVIGHFITPSMPSYPVPQFPYVGWSRPICRYPLVARYQGGSLYDASSFTCVSPADGYTITATAAVNGSITPSGKLPVSAGGSQTFTITANAGYSVANVQITGASVGAVATYTFDNVQSNATISASFGPAAETITLTQRVVDLYGIPVVGATVTVVTVTGDSSRSALTDANGTFVLPVPVGINFTYSISKSFYRSFTSQNFNLTSSTTLPECTIYNDTVAYLNISVTGTGEGKISTLYPSGYDCSGTCRQEYACGTTVSLLANAASNSTFGGWTGCDSENGTTCTVSLTSPRTVKANFIGPSLGTGSIHGTITNSYGFGVYQASAHLTREYDTPACAGNCIFGFSDINGSYSINNIVPGTYTLSFNNPAVPSIYGSTSTFNQWYKARYLSASADLVTINAGDSIEINTQYQLVGSVSGTVTDVNGTRIPNIRVFAFDLDENNRGSNWTDSNGEYILQNLPTGTYKIYYIGNRLAPPGSHVQNLMTQIAYVTVIAPYNVTGINATLSPGRTISGKVNDRHGNPIVAGVHIVDAMGRNISGLVTDSITGKYTALGIPPGSYKVLFMPIFPSNDVIDVKQLYSRKFYKFNGSSSDYNNADTVTVTDNADVTNIDGVLEATGPAVLSSWAAVAAVVFKWDFGAQTVGATSYRSITLSNAGTADLILGTLQNNGDTDFSIQYDRCSGVTLPPLKICTFAVKFTPQSEGDKTGAINIPSNDPNVPTYTIGLTGSGGAATGNSGYTGVPYSSPPNSSVTVTPVPQVNLTFSNVIAVGEATVTAITSLSTPTLSDFRMLNGASYDITTTATFSGNIAVCINYDPTTMGNPANEPNLRLFHLEVNMWKDITILPVNITSHTICGVTSSLSPFVVAEPNYLFSGFFNPIDNLPVLNNAKAGQAIPVKWRLTDAVGMPISDPASFRSLTSYDIGCEGLLGDPVSSVEEYSTGSSGLQYLGDGVWQFNWTTPKTTTYINHCRKMVLKLGDGSTHEANFKFK